MTLVSTALDGSAPLTSVASTGEGVERHLRVHNAGNCMPTDDLSLPQPSPHGKVLLRLLLNAIGHHRADDDRQRRIN